MLSEIFCMKKFSLYAPLENRGNPKMQRSQCHFFNPTFHPEDKYKHRKLLKMDQVVHKKVN